MKTILSVVTVALAATSAASGCYYEECAVTDARAYRGQAWVEVDAEPPPLRAQVEVRPPKPTATAVWVDGYWDWGGRWIWVDGHWETPRPGYVWTPPVARRPGAGGRIHYHPGHWRPADSAPPPVYREPGEVRVSVRPAQPAARGAVDVRTPDRAPVHVEQPGRTVDVERPTPARPSQTVTVRPATPAQPAVRQPSGVTVTEPSHRPAQGATVQPGVRVQTPGATTATPGTVRPTEPTGPTVRPGGTVQARPGSVRPSGPGVQQAGVGVRTPTGPGAATTTPGTVPLSCSLPIARVPRNGYVTIRGQGWGASPTVHVGGRLVTVVQSTRDQIRIQSPGSWTGGNVVVTDGNRTASCGNLQLIGR